jgi:hypothetical protein
MLPTSCRVLQASGGVIIGIPCLPMLRLSRISSRKLSGGHYIPPGLMAIKHTKFMKLT